MAGATVVLRQRDLELLAHDQRLVGIGLALFDLMGITERPLRDWYDRLMFTTEGDYHRRMQSLVSRAFTPRSVEAPARDGRRHGRRGRRFHRAGRRRPRSSGADGGNNS
jgi:cytochrome P450